MRSGRIEHALAVAGKFKSTASQVGVYAAIAEAAARAGLVEDALDAAAKVRDPRYQARAYAAIVKSAKDRGGATKALKDALDAAAKVRDPDSQARAYAAIAEAAAKAGLIEVAEKAEAGIPRDNFDSRSAAAASIAQALARERRFYEARVRCEPCEREDKLKAYTVILEEYWKQQHEAHPKAKNP